MLITKYVCMIDKLNWSELYLETSKIDGVVEKKKTEIEKERRKKQTSAELPRENAVNFLTRYIAFYSILNSNTNQLDQFKQSKSMLFRWEFFFFSSEWYDINQSSCSLYSISKTRSKAHYLWFERVFQWNTFCWCV